MVAGVAVVAVGACDGGTPKPRPAPGLEASVPVADAAIDVAAPDAADQGPALQCTFNGAKEMIRLQTDVATMTGWLRTSSMNPDREIEVKVVTRSATEADLLFLSYGKRDAVAMKRIKRANEPLVRGSSVVARLTRTGELTRILGIEVALHELMHARTHTNAYPCATANPDFDAKYPDEFVPR